MPWQMPRVTPNELGQILEIAKAEKAEHDKARRKSSRASGGKRARR